MPTKYKTTYSLWRRFFCFNSVGLCFFWSLVTSEPWKYITTQQNNRFFGRLFFDLIKILSYGPLYQIQPDFCSVVISSGCLIFIMQRSFKPNSLSVYIFTTRKRSLGQGNIFTPVYHSVHRGGIPTCIAGGILACLAAGGCLLPGGLLWGVPAPGEGVYSGGSAPGGYALGGICSRGGWWRPPPDGYCCGRYASHWNAFLLWSSNCQSKGRWKDVSLCLGPVHAN